MKLWKAFTDLVPVARELRRLRPERRLAFDVLEDRVVPSTVTITFVSNAYEDQAHPGGANGSFLISRGSDTVGDLIVKIEYDGENSTAGSGEDFTALPDTVTIPDGSSSVGLAIAAADDSCQEGPETVTVNLLPPDSCGCCSSPAYTVGSASTATLTIEDNDNTAPTITDPGTQSAFKGDIVSFQMDADDADEDTLTYSATGLPTGLSINSSTGLITETISTSASTSVPYSVTITVTDEFTGSTETTFKWSVSSAHVTVIQGDVYSIVEDTVSLEPFYFGVPNHTLTYAATGLPSGLSISSSTGIVSGTIASNANTSSPYSVTITATDTASGAYDEATFDWVVASGLISTEIDDAQRISDLNDISDDIETKFGLLGTVDGIGEENNFFARFNALMDNLEGYLDDVDDEIDDEDWTGVDDALLDYDNNRAALTSLLNEFVDTHILPLIEAAEDAAELAQGDSFRIRGILSDMNRLNERINDVFGRLEAQSSRFTFINSDLAFAGQLTNEMSTKINNAINLLESKMTSLDDLYFLAFGVYDDYIDDDPGTEFIADLNGYHSYLVDGLDYLMGASGFVNFYSDDLIDRISAMQTAANVPSLQDYHLQFNGNGSFAGFGNLMHNMIAYVELAVQIGELGAEKLNHANAAVTNSALPFDKFRAKGLQQMADSYTAYLETVRAILIERIGELESLYDDMPGGWLLERTGINGLSGSAIPALETLRDALTELIGDY